MNWHNWSEGLAMAATVAFAVTAAPAILGVITAIGGGLTRDVLAGRTTLLMRPELYAVPVLLGCILFTIVLGHFPGYRILGGLLCVLLTFALRAAAIHWGLKMPVFTRINQS
jgi:uncharacterized membrane protein YeiH